MKNISDKHIVVAGAARSGVAAALLLTGQGASVFVTDAGPIASHFKETLEDAVIPFEENGHTAKAEEGEFLVISPGIHLIPRLQKPISKMINQFILNWRRPPGLMKTE